MTTDTDFQNIIKDGEDAATPATDETSGVIYEPITDGWAVGYRCVFPDGRVEFIYLNPSGASDDGVPTVFVYQGAEGDPGQDQAVTHLVIGG